MPEPLKLGTQTQWGVVQAVGIRDGERYYMMVKDAHEVALMPAPVVEEAAALEAEAGE